MEGKRVGRSGGEGRAVRVGWERGGGGEEGGGRGREGEREREKDREKKREKEREKEIYPVLSMDGQFERVVIILTLRKRKEEKECGLSTVMAILTIL